jgi:hypothetical protein
MFLHTHGFFLRVLTDLTLLVNRKHLLITCQHQLCYSQTQPGHEPDLMQVKMDENCPGIDGNLHTVRVETARYGFCIRI